MCAAPLPACSDSRRCGVAGVLKPHCRPPSHSCHAVKAAKTPRTHHSSTGERRSIFHLGTEGSTWICLAGRGLGQDPKLCQEGIQGGFQAQLQE